MFYEYVNMGITTLTGNKDTVPLGVEPLLFGLLYMGFDLLFIAVKTLLGRIVADATRKVKEGGA